MVKFDTTEATFYEDGNQIEYFVGETIADRRVKEMTLVQAVEFCQEKGIDLYVQLEDGNVVSYEDYMTINTPKDIFFTIISTQTEEKVQGLVHYDCYGYKFLKWQNPLFGWYEEGEFPFTEGFLRETVLSHNLTNPREMSTWTNGFGRNDFGIYRFRDFDILINPQEVTEEFINTWVNIMTPNTTRYTRMSIGCLFEKLTGFVGDFIRNSETPHIANIHGSFDGENYGDFFIQTDAEIMDAIEKTILRMAFITKGDD